MEKQKKAAQKTQQNTLETCNQNKKILLIAVSKSLELTGYEEDEQSAIKLTEETCKLINSVFLSDLPGIPKIGIKEINKAIMLGSTGKYGKTYKLTGQEVCSWIWKYIDECGSRVFFNIENE